MLFLPSHAFAAIRYVDFDATGANNGSSWANAYKYLQDALVTASSGDEIWVAQGIYKPDQGASVTPGDRTATFQLKNGVAVKGGFAGVGETRVVLVYVTTLSGDLGSNDGPDYTNMEENGNSVTVGSGTDTTAILDGFTITGGYGSGAGMYNHTGSPTVRNCRFIQNTGPSGVGMCNYWYSSPQIINCLFDSNKGKDLSYYSSNGGGMLNSIGCNPTISNCTFINNSAEMRGGAIYNNGVSSPIVTDSFFIGNSSSVDSVHARGGGVHSQGGTPIFTNCTFSENSTPYVGGGFYGSGTTDARFENCTFSNNTAGWSGGGADIGDGTATLTNCTFNQNEAYIGGGIFNFRNSPLLSRYKLNNNNWL